MPRLLLLAIAVPLLLPGCFYPADRGRIFEQRVDRLTAGQEDIQRALEETRAKLAATLPRIDEKIAEVSQALDNLDRASRRTGADIGVQLQKNVEDLARLRGQVEESLHRIDQLEASLNKQNENVDRRLGEMQGEQAKALEEARKRFEELKRPADKKELLAMADAKAGEGDLALARQLYAEILRKWPRDVVAAEAHFGLGEAFRKEDRCREALYEYGKIVQEFPATTVAPEALLGSAGCFGKLDQPDASRLALEELVKSYPKADAAKVAKARLDELDKDKRKKQPPRKPTPAPKKGSK